SLLAYAVDVVFQLRHALRLCTKEGVVIDGIQIIARQFYFTHLCQITAYAHAVALGQELARNSTRSHAHRSFTCRRTATATIIPPAVFLIIGVSGMVGPEHVLDLAVIARTLVGVLQHDGNWCARGFAFENTGQYLRGVRLTPLGDIARTPRPAPVKLNL